MFPRVAAALRARALRTVFTPVIAAAVNAAVPAAATAAARTTRRSDFFAVILRVDFVAPVDRFVAAVFDVRLEAFDADLRAGALRALVDVFFELEALRVVDLRDTPVDFFAPVDALRVVPLVRDFAVDLRPFDAVRAALFFAPARVVRFALELDAADLRVFVEPRPAADFFAVVFFAVVFRELLPVPDFVDFVDADLRDAVFRELPDVLPVLADFFEPEADFFALEADFFDPEADFFEPLLALVFELEDFRAVPDFFAPERDDDRDPVAFFEPLLPLRLTNFENLLSPAF